MNKVIKITLSVVVIAALGVAGVKAVKKAKAKDAAAPVAKIYPIYVETTTVKKAPTQLRLPYLGEVHNDKDVALASRIAARITSIKSSGKKVKKGEVVATLDTTAIRSHLSEVDIQLKALKVAYDNMNATHQRTLDLLKVKGASIEQSQKEQTQLSNLEAKMATLKQKRVELYNALSYGKIVAPVSGVISKTTGTKGAMSMPGKPLVMIKAENGFYLLVRTPSDLKIKGVNFNNKSYDAMALGSTFRGLAEYKVYIDDTALTSGDRVEVSVIVFKGEGTLLPFDALLNRDGKSYVLVINPEGNATPKEVHILQSGEEGVVISDDLDSKKLVVAKPDILLKLVAGYALKIKE